MDTLRRINQAADNKELRKVQRETSREWFIGLIGVLVGAIVAIAVPFLMPISDRINRKAQRSEAQEILSWKSAQSHVVWCDSYFASTHDDDVFSTEPFHGEAGIDSAAAFALANCYRQIEAKRITFYNHEISLAWERYRTYSDAIIQAHLTAFFPEAYNSVGCRKDLPPDIREQVAEDSLKEMRKAKEDGYVLLRNPGIDLCRAYDQERQRLFEVVGQVLGATDERALDEK